MSPGGKIGMIIAGVICLGITAAVWSATQSLIWIGGIIVGLILIGKGIFSSD